MTGQRIGLADGMVDQCNAIAHNGATGQRAEPVAAGIEVSTHHPQPDSRGHGRFRPAGLADANEGRMADKGQSGRDQETGRFLPGNRFWEARSSAGPKPKFDGPEPLWAACLEYFAWVEANPLHEAKAFSYEGKVTIANLPKMRAMTIGGLCLFLDVTLKQWIEWRESRPDLSEVITRVEAAIFEQKFTGAAADLLNANIIARDLGLADRKEMTGANGGPVIFKTVYEE